MDNTCYSVDGEMFNLDSIDEVIDHFKNYLPEDVSPIGKKYWEADALPVLHTQVIGLDDINSFLETLDEQFTEFIEDPDFVYSDVPKEAKTELCDLVLNWADKHVTEGIYYRIKNVQERTIELEDLE